MQRLFHIAAGAAEAVEIDPSQLSRIRGDGWFWLDVTGFDEAEVFEVGDTVGVDPFALEEVVRQARHSKVEAYPEHTFFIGHGLSTGDDLGLIEYDAFIGPDYLLTFKQEDLPGFVWAREHVTTPGAVDVAGPDRIFSRIANAGALRFQPLLDALDSRIVDLEERAIDGHPEVPVRVQALRRDVVVLRGAAAPQRDVFSSLEQDPLPAIGERAQLRLGSVFDTYTRITEELDADRQLLAGVLDTYRSAVAERANEVMRVLTVFAAIVLPLSLMAGIYGMNFVNMPELDWRWGYFGLLGLMAVVGLGLWTYFAHRGFIGAPSLRSIQRGVGHGLAGIAGLTVVPTLRILGLGRRQASDEETPGSTS